MPAWFGIPPKLPADHGGPLPFVDPEPTQMWKNEVFKVGDCVTFEDEAGNIRRGVVEKEWRAEGERRQQLEVTTPAGDLIRVHSVTVERCSLLEVLAEASQ